VQGIIIDIRQNGGGSAYLGDQLPAYFFDEEYVLGNSAFYDESIDDFVIDPDDEDEFVLVDPSLRFEGEIAVLVGPNCASACESFAYNMTLGDRAAIVGQYPTAGLGGSVEDFNMPEGVSIRFTIGRSLDADGNIHIEGIGVVPNVRVPVTEETLLTDEDVILQYAIDFLDGELNVPTTDGGSIAVGETVEGELVEGERVRFTLEVTEDAVLDFIVSDEDRELDTVLRLYVQGNDAVAAQNDDDPDGGTVNSALREVAVPSGLIIEIEVGGFDDAISGTFSLTVRESPTPEDEPDNSTETNA
jgi:hypothetical protein